MKKIARAAVAAIAAIAGGFGILAVAPGLAFAVDGCDANRVCIFDDNNFNDRIGIRSAGGGRENVSSGNNDRMDSWLNDTGTDAAWYYNFTYENADNCRNMPHHNSDDNVGVFNSDELSSWRTDRGC